MNEGSWSIGSSFPTCVTLVGTSWEFGAFGGKMRGGFMGVQGNKIEFFLGLSSLAEFRGGHASLAEVEV